MTAPASPFSRPQADAVNFPLLWTVALSGHRDLPDESKAREAIRAQLSILKSEAVKQEACLVAVSSLARGADLIFAEECLAASVPWKCLLPFPEEEFQYDAIRLSISNTSPAGVFSWRFGSLPGASASVIIVAPIRLASTNYPFQTPNAAASARRLAHCYPHLPRVSNQTDIAQNDPLAQPVIDPGRRSINHEPPIFRPALRADLGKAAVEPRHLGGPARHLPPRHPRRMYQSFAPRYE